MKINELEFENFRNFKKGCIKPYKNINIVCGDNAQGKTNLIEAIWMFTGAKSFRGSKDKELIAFGEEEAKIKAKYEIGGIEKQAKIEIREKRTAEFNEKKITASSFAGNFYAIVFSPSDLSLIKDGPQTRRRFLDIAIGQLYPNYINILRQYQRAVFQRNNILKRISKDASLLPIIEDFEEQIAVLGEKIRKYRKEYVEHLKENAPKIYDGICNNNEKLEIEYIFSGKENLEEELKQNRTEDIYKGITSVGPHRDDLLFKINSINARNFASQGQKRSAALSMKLAEAQIIKNITGEQPIALLDDVMSELDKGRQDYILNHIKGWQVFITCCEEAHFEKLKEGKIFRVKSGEVE